MWHLLVYRLLGVHRHPHMDLLLHLDSCICTNFCVQIVPSSFMWTVSMCTRARSSLLLYMDRLHLHVHVVCLPLRVDRHSQTSSCLLIGGLPS